METPTSSRRVTRSQTLAASNNSIPVSKGKNEGSKTRTGNGKQQQERSALIDITNDSSPIVGLAMETPSSAVGKQRSNSGAKNMMMTPGSGEALLRGQVRTLLQRVEEEAVVSKHQFASRPFIHLQSPMGLVAPANTPQFPNLREDGIGGMKDLPVVEEQLNISEVVSGNFDGNLVIKRSLLMDFAEKSDGVDGVVLKEESSATKVKLESPDDDIDNASVWSIQVNASTHDDEYEETFKDMGEEHYCEDVQDYEEDGGLVDELCKGMSKIRMAEMFTGKHTRFIYNSDGEIKGEENIIPPTPKGKHLRFPLEEEDE